MKDWQDFPDDDELERADDLLGQADALLRRHRGDTAPSSPGTQRSTDRDAAEPVHATPSGAAMQAFDDDDLPILTEVVDDLDLPTEIFQPTESSLAAAAAAQPAFVRSLAPGEVSHARAPAAPPVAPMSEARFRRLLTQIRATTFADDLGTVIGAAARRNHFTCGQLGRLVAALEYAEEKVAVVRALRPRLVDLENAHEVLARFDFGADREAAAHILSAD